MLFKLLLKLLLLLLFLFPLLLFLTIICRSFKEGVVGVVVGPVTVADAAAGGDDDDDDDDGNTTTGSGRNPKMCDENLVLLCCNESKFQPNDRKSNSC